MDDGTLVRREKKNLNLEENENFLFQTTYILQVVAVASLPKEIASGLHPKQNNSIRALLLQSGWVVEKLDDDSCMVTYVVQVTKGICVFFFFDEFNV